MPTRPAARTADDITENIKSMVDRLVDTRVTHEMTKRGQEMATLIAERGAEFGDIINDAWRDSRPARRDAAKALNRASDDATKWSNRTWKSTLRPVLRDLWSQRTAAIGTAGAAVPAGRELVDSAAVRLGLKRREERHWGAFFLGLVLGAAAGAVVAMLTTPKRGSEMRQELGTRADELATKAKDADWVPIFQRDQETNGRGSGGNAEALADAAAESGTASGEAADKAAADAADAINEAYDTTDRESAT